MGAQANIPADLDFPNKWAFIVGVTDYEYIPKLNFAGNDAEELAKTLKDELQFQNVTELHSKATSKPDRDNIINELSQLCTESNVGEDDLLLFFFSGHGVIDGNKDYILPVRARLGTLADTGIQVEKVIEYLKSSKCKNIVMFIDACRELVTGAKGVRSVIGEASREALEQNGIITFFSCGPTDLSYEIEDLRHSSFTYCLLKAIKDKQYQTVQQIDEYLRKSISPLNTQHKKGAQRPYVVVQPLEKRELRIFTSRRQAEEATKDFDHIIAWLANLCISELLEDPIYEKAVDVVEKARNGDVDKLRFGMIERLIEEKIKIVTFTNSWKAIERTNLGGLAIQKPETPGSIR